MKLFAHSHPAVRKLIRGVYRQCRDDLHPLAVKLLPTGQAVQQWLVQKMFNLLFWSDALRFNAALYGARFRKRIEPALREIAAAARQQARRLWQRLQVYSRLGRTRAGKLWGRLNRYLQAARPYALAARARALALAAFMGHRLRSSSYFLWASFQMVLLILIILLVFLRPTQAEAPDIPTPTPRALAFNLQETSTPFLPLTATPLPSATPTTEPTAVPTIVATTAPATVPVTVPARVVKAAPTTVPIDSDIAETRLSGPGFCGAVHGSTGTGAFIWPTVEHALSGYDYRPNYYHFGLDLKGDRGSPIYAVDDGVVVYAGWNYTGYGNLVIIDHGHNTQSLYAHLSQIMVGCGESVQQGETIAKLGSTGNSTGPHLHFEVVTGDWTHLNPWDYLKK